MVKFQPNEGQKIFPILCDVDASDVGNQRRSYANEKNFNEKTVEEWREALTNVGELKGDKLEEETDGYEGELVKKVVRNVLLQLKKNYTHVPDDLVGMDHHIQEMIRLLHVDSDGVQTVGIHGMGGIGKTIIAMVIYNRRWCTNCWNPWYGWYWKDNCCQGVHCCRASIGSCNFGVAIFG